MKMCITIFDFCWILFPLMSSSADKGILRGNIALHKPASQSSTLYHAKSAALNAVDGVADNLFHNGSCTHTDFDDRLSCAWWEVDLLEQFRIGAVHILNRVTAEYRLHDVEINVYEDKATPNKRKHCITHPGPAGSGWLNLTCVSPVKGRFVRIRKPKKNSHDVLTLCEVEIYQPKEKEIQPMSYRNCCKICG